MFRQFLKLREARKAFREGRYRDALRLSEDPEIAQHLKALALRKAALDALERQAQDHEEQGDLTLAVAEIQEVVAHEPTPQSKEREQELVDRKKERDELGGRLRSRLYRAKLDLGRGDLLSARQAIEAIDPANRTDEMKEILREVSERLTSAEALLKKARKACTKDPAQAESLLLEAEKQHPRAEGLISAFRDLALSRVKHLTSAKVGDPAILAFLMEWSLFRRRHLDGINCDLEAGEKDLQLFVGTRAQTRLEAGDLAGAEKLLERLQEAIGLDSEGEKAFVALRHLRSTQDKLEVGDFDGAEVDLTEATSRLAQRTTLIKELQKEIKAKRKEITPAYEAAEESLKRGDVNDAKVRLLDVLEKLPGHRGSLRLLEIANEKKARRAQTLAEVRSLMDRRRLDAARRMLEDVFADGGDTHEISMLMKEIEVLEKAGNDRNGENPLAGELPVAPSALRLDTASIETAGHGPVSFSWMLTVEEHGEHMVYEADRVVIGNAVARSADMPVLANLGSRHAELTRKTSFHGGVVFLLEGLAGREVHVNDKSVNKHELADGDEVRLGRDFRFRFRQPTERSKAAVLEILSGHDVSGAKNVILMPPSGRAGCIRIGPFADAHVPAWGADGEVEIYRESAAPGAELVVVSTNGVAVDGDESRAKSKVYDQSRLTSGDLVLWVRNLAHAS